MDCMGGLNTAHLAVGRGDAGTEQMLLLGAGPSQPCTRYFGAREGATRGQQRAHRGSEGWPGVGQQRTVPEAPTPARVHYQGQVTLGQ